MGATSIAQLRTQGQAETGTPLWAWEEGFFQEACRQARQAAQDWLEGLDTLLLRLKPAGWRVVGKRRRTLVTRFGEVTFARRLYRDAQGRYRFLLDEVLDLPAYQEASPDVMKAVVLLATGMAFSQVAKVLACVTAGVLSVSTVWRLVQRVGRRVQEAERAEVEWVFGRGAPPQRWGARRASRLYVEADGVLVRQRTGQGRTVWKELRLGVAYDEEGVQRVYVQGAEGPDFWEGASLVWGAVWDWSRVEEVVVNGDDAAWVEGARLLHLRVVRQWDGFHVARAAYRAAGAKLGAALSRALQAGDREEVATLWAQVPVPGKGASQRQKKAWRWLQRHRDDPRMVRWWRQGGRSETGVETLGHIESLVGAIIAHRMKGKRRHGSLSGLQHMGKVLQVVRNHELGLWCGRYPNRQPLSPPSARSPHRTSRRHRRNPGAWLQARVPLLHGPVPTEPHLLRLRDMIKRRLN